ncbi:hypothetical protein KC333_g111 [Hortaea werneckii]|nr:hypothetical protein KC333_g111 [Hortaea werneckii]
MSRKAEICAQVVGNIVVHRMKEVWVTQEVEVISHDQCGSDFPVFSIATYVTIRSRLSNFNAPLSSKSIIL